MSSLIINLSDIIFNLIKKASCILPCDIEKKIREIINSKSDNIEKSILEIILQNIEISKSEEIPLCQDTGFIFFDIYYPEDGSLDHIIKNIEKECETAIIKATELNLLRPNVVNTITNKNTKNNIGVGFPQYHYHKWKEKNIKMNILLKGGGSENVSQQYSLPIIEIDAKRDLEGVRKVILHSIFKAQGLGCSPSIIGVCIGGDRASSYLEAKRQLFRKIDDVNKITELINLEAQVIEESNSLNIGAMGLGGKSTLLSAKISFLDRHPATFFVSIAFSCWALRRYSLNIFNDGNYIIC